MGRLHSNGKGISASALPYSRTPPAWLKVTPDQVEDQICKLAKKGATPSQIGVVLRDSHGIAQVKVVTETDGEIRTTGLAPEIPEDLYMLIKKVIFPMERSFRKTPQTNATIQTGRRRPQAPRAQPQGQGWQVPPHSHRVPYPPPVPLLQDRRRPASHLETTTCQPSTSTTTKPTQKHIPTSPIKLPPPPRSSATNTPPTTAAASPARSQPPTSCPRAAPASPAS
ncbi:hypothetical protein FH972_025943 [Carpinus fangiana]|uniref:Small ribosomal subunit protein uS15 N-terminal domain-containing protein n=1 Tax=Carpinus fangiana TaxID=176857 RepID=A0A5N6L3G8_9ROSI|nr:hypothetical protein FH972_025943 [Carpinus fangiana]